MEVNPTPIRFTAGQVQDRINKREDPHSGDLKTLLDGLKGAEAADPNVETLLEEFPAVQSLVDSLNAPAVASAPNAGTPNADTDKPADAAPAPKKPEKPEQPKPHPNSSDQAMLRSQAQAEYAHGLLKAGEDPASDGGRINKLVGEIAKSERGDPAIKDWVKSHYSDVQKLVDKAARADAG